MIIYFSPSLIRSPESQLRWTLTWCRVPVTMNRRMDLNLTDSNAVSERHSGNTLKSLVLKLSNQETLKYFNFYNHFLAPGPFVLNEDINV